MFHQDGKGLGKSPSELLRAIVESVEDNTNEREYMRQADDYYEGEQLTKDVVSRREKLGLPNPTVTLVTEAINSVTGQEIKRRTDTQVTANTDEDSEMAEAVNFLLQQQEEILDTHQIDSDAYEGMVVPGIGWVYVGQSDNPLRRGMQVLNVEREDVITDRRSVRRDDSDCEWRTWRRFMTPDAAKMILPAHAELIDHVSAGSMQHAPFMQGVYQDTHLGNRFKSQFYRTDRLNSEISLYCVWYRSYKKRTLLVDGNSVQVYDEKNIEHVTMLEDENIVIELANVPVMREAWYVGPFLALDEDSPHPHNEFPLIEARGYMRKKDRRRYGLIEHAIGPQDEYNLLCIKIAEVLVSKRIMWEQGAFGIGPEALKPEQVRDEFMRRDTMIQLAKGGLDKVRVENDWAELSQLVGLKEQARDMVRIAMGVNYAFTGETEGDMSGTAIASLAELSAATMGRINSNYEYYRKRRAWLQIAHILQEIGNKEHQVNIRDASGEDVKKIMLNKREGTSISNQLSLSKIRIKLKHIATSQGYKAFNHQRLTEMHNGTDDPVMKQALAPAIIKNSDVPDADQILEDYMQGIGKSEDPEAQKQAAEQAAMAKELQQLEVDERRAAVDKLKAETAKINAEAGQSGGSGGSGDGGERAGYLDQLKRSTAQNQLNQLPAPSTLQ